MNMTRMEKIQSDLSYVRSIVDRQETSCSPPAIYFLWAAITLVGFGLYDHGPGAVPLYWSIAGPVGGVLSFFLGWQWSRKRGQSSTRIARYHALHWVGMMVAVFLAVPLHSTGLMESEGLARAILIILALGYYTAGIYLVRSFLWIGLVMTGGYVALFFFDSFTWTAVGALVAVSLVWAGVRELLGGSSSD
jgi:hypothetical protein